MVEKFEWPQEIKEIGNKEKKANETEKLLKDIITLKKYEGNDTQKGGKNWNYSP